jgi:hypothetical protein
VQLGNVILYLAAPVPPVRAEDAEDAGGKHIFQGKKLGEG